MIKKLLSLSENLFTKTAFLTFAFRSKCRVNKSTSCKKNREKTNTPLRVVKNQEHRNIALLSLQLRSYKQQNDFRHEMPTNDKHNVLYLLTLCAITRAEFNILS